MLVNRCYTSGESFGVALIQSGKEVGRGAVPFMVGCTASITELDPLPGGRYNIVAVGGERFQIHALQHDQPYLVGMVESFPLVNLNPDLLGERGKQLRPWVRRYLQTLAKASESEFDLGSLPADPLRLANLASFLLQIPAGQKQTLLAMNDADELVVHLRDLYRREVTLLEAMVTAQEHEGIGPFSIN